MKKLLILLLLPTLLFNCSDDDSSEDTMCDNGTFIGDVYLKTQAEVNAFGEQCYTKINGTLFIGADSAALSDITDLSPLNNLTELFADELNNVAKIWVAYNPELSSLRGLQNIVKADGLLVSNNASLVNLEGLEGLTALFGNGGIHDIIVFNNDSLESLVGLNNITVVGAEESPVTAFISIQRNNNLTNLNALSNLTNVYGNIYIGYIDDQTPDEEGNMTLTDYCGLSNLFDTGYYEEVFIVNNAYNPSVQDITGGNCSE